MPFDRTDAEVLHALTDTIKDEIRVCLPATVTAVDPILQTVDVVIGVKNPLHDEYGNTTFETLPSVAGVPLACMRGGGFFAWFPVAVGDSVMLVYSDLSLDAWMAGDASQVVTPVWLGKHTGDSCVAIPCIAPMSKALASPVSDPTKLIIGKDGSAAQIRIGATDIELGAVATDFVALASKVDANFAALLTAFNSHVHAVAAFGPSAVPTVPEGGVPTVASTLVKSG